MRLKRAHALAPIKHLSYPRRFVFFDTESTVRNWGLVGAVKPHVPRLIEAEAWEGDGEGGGYSLREEREFLNEEDTDESNAVPFKARSDAICAAFWAWLDGLASGSSADRASVVVIGHNVGYDVQVTGGVPTLQSLGWTFEMPYVKGPVYIWRATKNRRSIAILSSTNFYQTSGSPDALRKLGDTFSLPKLDDDPNVSQTKSVPKLRRYCRRDVEIARVAVLALVDLLAHGDVHDDGSRHAVGTWGDTLSSMAFKAYRYRFMPYPIDLHVEPDAEKLERDAYVGGRTEAFFIAHYAPLPVYKLDVNSLYPSVMISNLFPTRLLGVRTGDLPAMIQTVETGGLVIAEVEIETDVPCAPLKDVKLLFPVGRFITTLCSPELKVALQEGRLLAVGKWAVYDGAPIFEDYISWIYAQRLKARRKGMDAWDTLFKYLGNNLYGKFGQRREEWVKLREADPNRPSVGVETILGPNGSSWRERTFDGWVWRSEAQTESYNSFPAVAAFVTSYARVRLWSLMNVAGNYDPTRPTRKAGREFYYCDTDSLFASTEGYNRLLKAGEIHKDELGRLKIERIEEERAIFWGAKWYELGAHMRRKGIPASARGQWPDGTPVLTEDGKPAVVYDGWPRLLTAFKEGNLTGFENRPVVKKATVEYSKGVVWADGWVQPLRYPLVTPTEGINTPERIAKVRDP